jgi:putative transcription factor
MGCELCGRDLEEFFSAIIEGSTLQVCSNCSKFGQVVERKGKINVIPIKQKVRRNEEDIEFIVPEYSKLIKEAREKKGLTQEELAKNINEKESLIHQVESGHMKPDLNLALKLGKYFEINLVEKYIEPNVKDLQINFKNKNLTIGDLIKFKKDEKD